MTIFYSAKGNDTAPGNAFFDDGVFGTRTIVVVDEKSQKGILKALSDLEEALHAELEEAAEGEPREAVLRQLDQLRSERAARLEKPALMEVDNPECRLPEDAVEISAERHAELMQAQAKGKTWRPGADGMPEIVERERSAEEVLAAARASRDRQLAATDWTQLPDALEAAKRKLWATHRQHLRELPARIEELIGKGKSAAEAAELVQRNVANTKPKGAE